MFNIKKKGSILQKKDPHDLKMQVKNTLEGARRKNNDVINMELNQIRYNRKNNTHADMERRSYTKIKKALYSNKVIDELEYRITDMTTTEDLFSAFNDIASAMKGIRRLDRKTEMPKNRKFVRARNKLDKVQGKNDGLIAGLYYDEIAEYIDPEVFGRVISGDIDFDDDALEKQVPDQIVDDLLTNKITSDNASGKILFYDGGEPEAMQVDLNELLDGINENN